MTALKSRSLLLLTSAVLASTAACEQNILVDDPAENPALTVPVGIIRGTANYIGPGPCFFNGRVQGALVLLVFEYNNPPPPEGLATTALNLATIPGDLLFQGVPRPTDPAKGGPSDDPKKRVSFCPALDGDTVNAAADFTVSQMPAGRYQIRAFYSRKNTFSPLFDFANLPVAGDEIGGAIIDPSASTPVFLPIEIGVPDPANAGKFVVPPTGFVKAGIPVFAGTPLRTNRPYFYVDYAGSRGFKSIPDNETAKDVVSAYPTGCNQAGGGKCYDERITGEEVGITFPQDHPITAQQKLACLSTPDINCSVLEFAEKSLPSIHFKYGFPGDPNDPAAGSADAWIAKNAKPATGFGDTKPSPYYEIDPLSAPSALLASGEETVESKKFALSRNVFHSTVAKENGQPAILVDNEALEGLARIADLFPGVVLAKLQEDDEGNLIQPGVPQTDPIVIIQGFTLRQNSMKATSEGGLIGGPFCSDPSTKDPITGANACGDLGATNPLHKPGAFELVDDFTALIRPAALCVNPSLSPELKGTLVIPYALDPNPDNTGDKSVINPPRLLETQAARVDKVEFGCIPAGYYSINVVQPTGQAWSLPNLMGTCSYSPGGKPIESCARAPDVLTSSMITTGFALRP
ncbi:MAG: hypothetical protein ABI175_22020, partial [Polyangiales bacterium]